MATNALTEELGPIAQRRIRVVTIITVAGFVAVAGLVLWKLAQEGQMTPDKWTPYVTNTAVLEVLWDGLVNTLKAAATAMVLATIIGFALALLRLSRNRIVRGVALSYVEVFRSLPLLLVIFLFALALPRAGLTLGIFWSLVAALVTYNSATLSEIFRAGINSLDKGQTEAAQAVGMTYWQQMFIVVLPQAVRRMVPAIVAQLATLTKDVSLGFVISYPEFVRRGQETGQSSQLPGGNFQAYFVVGVVYFILIWLLAKLADYLDQRQSKSPVTAGIKADVDDEDAELEKIEREIG